MKTSKTTIRMYRQGLGDCFLIGLPRGDGDTYFILIDCGVVLGTENPAQLMQRVVADIIAMTKGRVDLLVATHEHWDHLSGFLQARELFEGLAVDEVWFAWTEDPNDRLATTLRGERRALHRSLAAASARMRFGGCPDPELEGLLEFFGAAGQGTTAQALEVVKDLCPHNIRFCEPGQTPFTPEGVDARLYVLGPPRNEKAIRSGSHRDLYGIAAAQLSEDVEAPFSPVVQIPLEAAMQTPFFQAHYWGEASEDEGQRDQSWRRIDAAWLDAATDLALQLDNSSNNTSLVLAIELGGGEVLLFAADAQVGSWLSWRNVSWQVEGKTVIAPDLLSRTTVYKAGHHGSHNATLRENGLEAMKHLRIALIPVDQAMAVKKRWGKMPLNELELRLNEITRGGVLRADRDIPAALQDVAAGTDLYYEITL